MIEENEKWQQVQGKMEELRTLVDGNWSNEEWVLAAMGENILRTVEESKASAEMLRQKTNKLLDTVAKLQPEDQTGC